MTDLEKTIILSMCRNNLCVQATARELSYSKNAIPYHIKKILNETGLDCRKFYDAIKLLEMIKEE
jgi:sugar diacid utilization regulator